MKTLSIGQEIRFGNLLHTVSMSIAGYYLNNNGCLNDEVFEILQIKNKNDYVKKILGYECEGCFPATKSLEDLTMVVEHLQKDYDAKFNKKLCDNLIENEVYFTCGDDGDCVHVFRFLGGNMNNCRNTCLYNSKEFTKVDRSFGNRGCFHYHDNLRLATDEERRWLEACEKAGKLVEKPKEFKFKKGKWYRGSKNSQSYRKCSEDGDMLSYRLKGAICDGMYRPDRTGTATWITAIEIPIEEIQQYLPDDHEDKIKSPIIDTSGSMGLHDGVVLPLDVADALCSNSRVIKPSYRLEKQTKLFYSSYDDKLK